MRPELLEASELLRQNTPEAVEKAIGLLQDTVFSFSMKMCGHREDAEDTMQDVLFRSLKHLAKVQDPNALAAWLYTVTRNRCRRIRRTPLESSARTVSLDELMPNGEELRRLLLDIEKDPERVMLHAEEEQLLHHAILHVPSSLRIVLVLHDMEELDTGAVARILGLQEGTVRVRLHRARLVVRKEMANLLSGASTTSYPSGQTGNNAGSPRSQECRELFANLSEYLDARVDSRTCDQMQAHIESCPACVAFLKELKLAIERCRSMKLHCDPAVAARMRSIFTREYLRLVEAEPAASTR